MSSIPSLARLRLESLALCLLAVPLFTLGLWEQPFIGFDGRFALFAQEMFRHGASAFPTSYGQPYPDYPATSTLLIDVFAQLFGEVNRLATVIPTALASAAIVGLLYRLLAERSRAWGLLAVLVLLLTNGFLAKARSICSISSSPWRRWAASICCGAPTSAACPGGAPWCSCAWPPASPCADRWG